MNKIIFLSGPTAVGKSDLALRLARRIASATDFGCEVVNFDSLLFYRELSIGTAKPTPSQRAQVVHHLVDTASVREPMNAARFVAEAGAVIRRLFASGTVPLLVGGSGFYLRALVKGMVEARTPSPELKEEIDALYAREGTGAFVAYLEEHDPESLSELHKNDHYRITRAYEYHRTTGRKFSEGKKSIERPYDFSSNGHPEWNFLHLHLDVPKEEHAGIIRTRSRAMIEDGLVDEVRHLLDSGYEPSLKALSAVGYKQVLAHLAGAPASTAELLERIVIATRQLAKAQRTFFKKITPKLNFHPLSEESRLTEYTLSFLGRGGLTAQGPIF